MNDRYRTFDEYLAAREEKRDKEKAHVLAKKVSKKKKRNKRKVAIVAIALAVVTALSGLGVHLFKKSNNKNKENPDIAPTTSYSDDSFEDSSAVALNDLGVSLENTHEYNNSDNKEIGNVTGNINPSEIVTDKEGTNWKDQQAEDNKDNIGTVTEAPTVVPSNDYIIQDSNGNTVSTGTKEEDGLPSGYHEDPSGRIVKDGYHVDSNGNIVKDGTTVETAPVQEETTVVEKIDPSTGTINADGTYTDVSGNLWATKSDYDKFLNNPDSDCYILGGKLYYGTYKVESYSSTTPIVEEPKVKEEITTEPEKEETETTTEIEITENADGSYTDSLGQTWGSYSDFENASKNPEGIYYENGYFYCNSAKTLIK